VARNLHIVSHTHWDREWHQTFQQFRLRLVQLIDDVLSLLAADHVLSSFLLDGQTIVLADYLEIRPERRAELHAHIAHGRLFVGPWYVHPDEFLVSGEALLRNLLQGRRDGQEWGGRMAIGYVPDQFGHIAQLPQIWRGFNIDTAVLWRGVDCAQSGIAFTWRSLDHSTVLAIVLPDGYNHAEHLPHTGPALADRLRALAASQERLADPAQPLLIMHGGDHAPLDARPLGALDDAQQAIGDAYLLLSSTLPRYREALVATSAQHATITGELRNSRTAPLLPAVASARMWIKQRNAAAQTLLERQAEPLNAFAAALGASPRGAELRQSWRYLLQNQPHDSIGGCGIDTVHHEMPIRYDWCEQIALDIRRQALDAIASRVHSILPGATDPHTIAVTVFNGANAPQRGMIHLSVRLAGDVAGYELVDHEDRPVPHLWEGERGEPPSTFDLALEEAPDRETILAQLSGDRVLGMGLHAISVRTIGHTLHVEITVGDQAILSRADIEQAMRDAFALIEEARCDRVHATIYRSAEVHLTALTPPVPALGYHTLLLRPRATPPARSARPRSRDRTTPAIENERYRVEADPATGALTIVERTGGMTLGPANIFIDGGEAGDLYTHSAPPLDALVGSAVAPRIQREIGALGQTLRIALTLRVPAALAESRYERCADTIPLPIHTSVSLLPGDPLIRFRTVVENAARDHRLRVHTTALFGTDHVHVADAFAVLRRVAQPERDGSWVEQPTGTAPHQGVVAIHGAGGCCILAARGLPEYEALPQPDGTTQLALTLLRCVGWLSRSDIPHRPGDAGPPLPVPGAQCAGAHTFEYALACGTEHWRDLWPAAEAFAVGLCATTATCCEGFLPPAASLCTVTPAAVVLSALKEAEDGSGAVLRAYNQASQPQLATIRLLLPVSRVTTVSLAEQDGPVLFDGAHRTEFSLTVPAHGIVSLRLRWAAR
jgi:alpha-mannosidase